MHSPLAARTSGSYSVQALGFYDTKYSTKSINPYTDIRQLSELYTSEIFYRLETSVSTVY